MRCKACNTLLNDMELKRKDINGDFLDMCHKCADQSYLYAFATFDDNGNVESFTTPPEKSYRWDYVGGTPKIDDADLSDLMKRAISGEILN